MSQAVHTLADEIIRIVQINRRTINGLAYGELIFRTHQGRLVKVTVAETLELSTGVQLSPLHLDAESK